MSSVLAARLAANGAAAALSVYALAFEVESMHVVYARDDEDFPTGGERVPAGQTQGQRADPPDLGMHRLVGAKRLGGPNLRPSVAGGCLDVGVLRPLITSFCPAGLKR